jgi:hypothetical protein
MARGATEGRSTSGTPTACSSRRVSILRDEGEELQCSTDVLHRQAIGFHDGFHVLECLFDLLFELGLASRSSAAKGLITERSVAEKLAAF